MLFPKNVKNRYNYTINIIKIVINSYKILTKIRFYSILLSPQQVICNIFLIITHKFSDLYIYRQVVMGAGGGVMKKTAVRPGMFI